MDLNVTHLHDYVVPLSRTYILIQMFHSPLNVAASALSDLYISTYLFFIHELIILYLFLYISENFISKCILISRNINRDHSKICEPESERYNLSLPYEVLFDTYTGCFEGPRALLKQPICFHFHKLTEVNTSIE